MRIATSQIHTLATLDLQRAQTDLFEAQRQTGSERKAADLKGYARDAGGLVGARAFRSLSDAYVASATTLTPRLELQAVALEQTASSVQEFRLALTEAVGLDSGSEMMSRVELAFQSIVGSMNVTYGGAFVFGGVRDDQAPVQVATLDDLAALPAASDAFDNSTRRPTAQVDVNVTLDVAPVASEIVDTAFAAFKRVRDYEIANGAFSGPLTAAQRTFLEGEISAISAALDDVHSMEAENGGMQQRLATVLSRQTQQQSYFDQLVGEIETVDLAAVASRLAQADLQLQASAEVYSQLRRSTLLDVL